MIYDDWIDISVVSLYFNFSDFSLLGEEMCSAAYET